MKQILFVLLVLCASVVSANPRDAAMRLRHGDYAGSAVAVKLEQPPEGGIGWALTAAHVFKAGKAPIVLHGFDYDADGKIERYHEFPAKIYRIDHQNDLALLEVFASKSDGVLRPAPLAPRDYQYSIHDALMSYGCAGGRDPDAKPYLPVTHLTDPNYTRAIIVDDGNKQGRSGGPLFNSKGQIVGIASASEDKPATFNLITGVEGREAGPLSFKNAAWFGAIDTIWLLFD